jgi:hypothetical protein
VNTKDVVIRKRSSLELYISFLHCVPSSLPSKV